MEKIIPEFLVKKIEQDYSKEEAEAILEGLKVERKTTFRVNRIKATNNEIAKVLKENDISYLQEGFLEDAFMIDSSNFESIKNLTIYQNGKIYMQNLAAMIPVIVLEPKEKENILDMCAAPGGKTSQIASQSNNKTFITACEKNKIRWDRLKYNLEKQGVKNIHLMKEDSRNLSNDFKFDKILLDSPCSRKRNQ